MPIQLLWGDDSAALDRAIQTVINNDVDPNWASVNVSRLDGSDAAQARQALEEASTPPLGAGARVVLLQAVMPSAQVAPLRQGSSAQSSMSISQLSPS